MANSNQSSDSAQQGIGTRVKGLTTKDSTAPKGIPSQGSSGQPNKAETNRNKVR